MIDPVAARRRWARLAAWNAFLLQVYADNLVAPAPPRATSPPTSRSSPATSTRCANIWVAGGAQGAGERGLLLRLPPAAPAPALARPRPHRRAARRDARTLDTGRTRVASELERFEGDDAKLDGLRVRLAEIDAEAGYVERLWTEEPTYELRCTIGDCLTDGLDDVYELGHLLAQPALLEQLLELTPALPWAP